MAKKTGPVHQESSNRAAGGPARMRAHSVAASDSLVHATRADWAFLRAGSAALSLGSGSAGSASGGGAQVGAGDGCADG